MTGSKRKPADPQGATTWSGAVGYEVFAVLCVRVTPVILSPSVLLQKCGWEVFVLNNGRDQKECAHFGECLCEQPSSFLMAHLVDTASVIKLTPAFSLQTKDLIG